MTAFEWQHKRIEQTGAMDDAVLRWHTELEFNAPLSSARAEALIASLQPLDGASVVDLGCGWGELLLRLLEREPTARGVGVDTSSAAIARAERNAVARGLGDRVRFEVQDASTWREVADRAIVVGSSHAWGGTRAALDAVRSLLTSGGRVLFGEGFWDSAPTSAALAALEAEPDDLTSLPELVDLCIARDFRVLAVATANSDEWDTFESRYCAGGERWLIEHPDSPDARDMRAAIEAHRDGWLRGYRGVLGFAYLTLAVP